LTDTLIRLAQAFAETDDEQMMRKWADEKLADLKHHEEGNALIINQVKFESVGGKAVLH
jgi:hypothetical protein